MSAPPATSRLISGCSPVSTSELLDVALGGAHRGSPGPLSRRVQVRLVGGERAVLAVTATGPRERKRQVAREGDLCGASSDRLQALCRLGRALDGGALLGGWPVLSVTDPLPDPSNPMPAAILAPRSASTLCQCLPRAPGFRGHISPHMAHDVFHQWSRSVCESTSRYKVPA